MLDGSFTTLIPLICSLLLKTKNPLFSFQIEDFYNFYKGNRKKLPLLMARPLRKRDMAVDMNLGEESLKKGIKPPPPSGFLAIELFF